ncbi:hypothetical protein [Bordetella genomosp. 1]|uniref:hypothetical protein n=1 Tax=Bordetella genomosp. 1 TaxID=1395607 RepID=UPI0011410B4F|nr:hypothetical protein [Bordetella genomosp. 1]MDQ8032274.1 hypothetical protein [Bordetella sp.]
MSALFLCVSGVAGAVAAGASKTPSKPFFPPINRLIVGNKYQWIAGKNTWVHKQTLCQDSRRKKKTGMAFA